ncbi:MAG: alpha/beta hydrolase [Solirubrobacterales bacterium]|nr:alpha/beta hydrolase [Solirubrobacterales bacterium]
MAAAKTPEPVEFAVERSGGPVLRGDDAGAGFPIVLLHGLTATRRNVVQGSRHLLTRGWRLVGYDARGHGESSAAPAPDGYGYQELAGDLTAVLDARGIERAVLAGSSMGAGTAVRFALDSPERVAALALITPPITPPFRRDDADDDSGLAVWDRRADALAAGDVEGFVDATGVDALPERWRGPARLATRQRIERHRDLAAVADALRGLPRSRLVGSLDEIAAIAAPALVVGSRDDGDPGHPLAIAEAYAERLPHAELAVEEPGETPLAWQGARLSRTIDEFLAGAAAGAIRASGS